VGTGFVIVSVLRFRELSKRFFAIRLISCLASAASLALARLPLVQSLDKPRGSVQLLTHGAAARAPTLIALS
jgi:hypothetical protein